MITIAYCATCNNKLVGEKLNRIGDNYYCHSDYSKELEKPINLKLRRQTQEIKTLLSDFNNLIETDLTSWNLIECTEINNVVTT